MRRGNNYSGARWAFSSMGGSNRPTARVKTFTGTADDLRAEGWLNPEEAAALIEERDGLLEAAKALLFQVDGVHQMACAYGPGENSEDFEQVRDTPDPGCPDCRAMQLAERAIRKAEGS